LRAGLESPGERSGTAVFESFRLRPASTTNRRME